MAHHSLAYLKQINKIKLPIFLFISFLYVQKMAAQCRQLVWSDEFNGTTLNANNWSFDVGGGGWGNNELQYYTDRTDNATVGGGTLKVIAKTESYGGRNYTSARLVSKSKVDFQNGRIEARLKLPQTQGLWPAFWLLPTDNAYGNWPNSGEIDIMELLGHQPNITYATIHGQGATAGSSINSSSNYTLPSGTFASDFHVFAVEWSSVDMKFYVDNVLIATKTAASLAGSARPWPFDQRFHILLNVAVGGNWPGNPNATTILPQTMEVDYVRLYQSLGEGNITGATRIAQYTPTPYSLPFAADATYSWTADTHGAVTSGQNTATPNAQFADAGGTLTATASSPTCGNFSGSVFVEMSHNFLRNPSFETQTFANWSTRPNGFGTITNAATGAYQGSRVAVVNVPTAAPNSWDIQLSYPDLALVAGQSYTLRFWAKADQANRRISAAIINSTTYNAYFLQNIDLTTNWTEYSYTFTASTTANCLFNFDCGRGGIFYFDYALLAQTETILSVELLDFTAKKKGNAVHVSWTLSHNNDLKHVEIERSDDGKRFATIVQKHYRSSSQKVIQDVLEDTPPSMPTFYRLKWTDLSGATAYSKVVSVDESEQFGVQVFPNPVADELTIRTSAGEAHRICVFDSFGRKVLEQKLDTPSHLIQIPTLDWASGLYFLQIESAFAKIKTVQFLKK